ncbi:MAG: ribonuclease Y, partial [Meiothermus sp.]
MPLLDIILIAALLIVGYFAFTLNQRLNRLGEANKSDLEASKREATRLLEAAKAESKTLIETARAEARAVREAAQGEVKALRESAQSEADRLRLSAQADVERLRREGEERLRAQLKEERERMLITLAAERETLTSERNSVKAERERLQSDLDSVRAEREELKREAERLGRRGEQLDARAIRLDEQEEKLDTFEKTLYTREAELTQRERGIDLKLQEVAGMSREEARDLLFSRLDAELEEEKALKVKANLERVRLEVKREAQKLIAQAAQRQASETAASLAVSVVPIPSDAMKGRIIGREGRNIRTFEALTGVDLIIDDTPEAVLLSGFNPVRREIARMALEQLVGDGRIHPSRIEEVVEKAKNEMKTFIYERGEEAALEAGVVGLKPGLVQLLGRLHFRSSYGQNVLKHSVQVAHLTGIMASELGLDAAMGRRAGLLHDIGKSVDREIEGTHVEIGITLAGRFGEPKEVIDAIAHHHDPENNETIYSVLAAAADAISAARPG